MAAAQASEGDNVRTQGWRRKVQGAMAGASDALA
jgi:hypothetical protein